MKKILLDLGSHKLEGLTKLIKNNQIDDDYHVYCYEANPFVYKESLKKKSEFLFKCIEISNLAVSDFNGNVFLNLDESKESQGCNILKDPPREDVTWKTKYYWTKMEIECISIERILENINIKSNDEIVIKCDIEGSEFEVLKMLLSSKYVENVKKIYVEWHERLWHPNTEFKVEEKKDIINKIKKNDIELIEWE